MEERNLRLVDIFIHEEDKKPVLDITLYNAGSKVALPMAAKITILDVGEFFDVNDDQVRSFNAVTQTYYGVVLSPRSLGQEQVIKISHLLRPEESDRFQLVLNQRTDDPTVVYTWYRLQVTIVYNEQAHNITSQPILLSIPPVDRHRYEIWESGRDASITRNKATLNRMASQIAKRSHSVEATIQSYGPKQPPAPPERPPVASSIDDPVSIFFAYAPEDEVLVKRLDHQLAVLRHNNLITNWHIGISELGKNVKQEVAKHLQQAHIIVLFISPDFLASQYDIIHMLEQGSMHETVVIPVLLRPTAHWQTTFLGNLPIVPRNKRPITTWSNPEVAFAQVAEEIARVVERQVGHPQGMSNMHQPNA
ncbi:MAG: TIR domain-containing protein [Chloroflexi bacterium]|nr:MAG: TIR domain-containing protein [Chloroflexota bacterium]